MEHVFVMSLAVVYANVYANLNRHKLTTLNRVTLIINGIQVF